MRPPLKHVYARARQTVSCAWGCEEIQINKMNERERPRAAAGARRGDGKGLGVERREGARLPAHKKIHIFCRRAQRWRGILTARGTHTPR